MRPVRSQTIHDKGSAKVPRRSTLQSETGVTLLETLAALLLVAFTIQSIAQLMDFAVSADKAAHDLTQVSELAGEQIEALRNLGYDQLVPGGSLVSDVAGYFDSPDTNWDGASDYIRRWEIADLGSIKQIRVRALSPLAATGDAKEVTVVALVAQR